MDTLDKKDISLKKGDAVGGEDSRAAKKPQSDSGRRPSGRDGHRGLKHWELISIYLFLYDVVVANAAYFIALWLRFDLRFSSIPKEYLYSFLKFSPYFTACTVIIFLAFGLYNSLWRFASFDELNRIMGATVIVSVFHIVGITLFFKRMPISYYAFGPVIQFCLTVGLRFSYRYISLVRTRQEKTRKIRHRAIIIGAGAAGRMIVRELQGSLDADAEPVCIIDDNSNKWGRRLEGVPIVGGRESILDSVNIYQADQILFAISKATPEQKRDILNICKETKCELRTLPGLYQLASGEVSLSKMKKVEVEDLLGREPIRINLDEIFEYIKGKRILVTGTGSIGSELCRQIAGHEPGQLILFDIYENNAYEIQQELKRQYPDLNLVTLIGSVRDSRRLDQIFAAYKPEIVYHAAAHKHVPLMEDNPNESIKNNVVGTYKTAYAALKHGAQRFVLISTDKAVNPTNIMGASKRLCEMVIQCMDVVSKKGRIDLLPFLHAHMDRVINGQVIPDPIDHIAVDEIKQQPSQGKSDAANPQSLKRTEFVAVRFGNVLGSNGSVIPLFKKQIEEGGPVTVTHPDIIRYFMTIPEAVSLVLQAGAYARGGEIFVLDMGEPVKIEMLARNLIRLSGYTPNVDIMIEYTGLRPGEKLYEEKLMAEEGLLKTNNELIHIGKPIPFDTEKFLKQLEQLARASYENSEHIVEMVEEIVPTFHPAQKKA